MFVNTILGVFTIGNLFLMAVALLPIGPSMARGMAAIPYVRGQLRAAGQRKRDIEINPEKGLSPRSAREARGKLLGRPRPTCSGNFRKRPAIAARMRKIRAWKRHCLYRS